MISGNAVMVAVVLTAIQEEFRAVRKHLSDVKRCTHPHGTVYHVGTFRGANGEWKVALCQIGPGNPNAAVEAERAISHFAPSVAGFVGVAGGLKDASLGDVVTATKIYSYESGKEGAKFMPRPEVFHSAYELESLARALANDGNWTDRIAAPRSSQPKAFVSPIAAGEKVVSSERSRVYRFLRDQYGDALAVEMEGLGFLSAAHANRQVAAVVVRGISDQISGKEAADKAGFQAVAAQNASAFFFELLSDLESIAQEPRRAAQAPVYLAQAGNPLTKTEMLYTNLMPLTRYPRRIFYGQTEHRLGRQVRAALLEMQDFVDGSFVLQEGLIISFENLREAPWSHVCDAGTVDSDEANDWAHSEYESERGTFVELLKSELRHHFYSRTVHYNKKLDLYYFAGRYDGRSRSIKYSSKVKEASRDVVHAYLTNDRPPQLKYLRHAGLQVSFRYIGDRWFIALLPSYMFTQDGRNPIAASPNLISGIKAQEGNQAVLGQVVMWSRLLESKEDQLLQDTIGFGPLETLGLDRGIPDAAWSSITTRRNKQDGPHAQLPLFT